MLLLELLEGLPACLETCESVEVLHEQSEDSSKCPDDLPIMPSSDDPLPCCGA